MSTCSDADHSSVVATAAYCDVLSDIGVHTSYELIVDNDFFDSENEDAWRPMIDLQHTAVVLHTKYESQFGRRSNLEFAEDGFVDDELVGLAKTFSTRARGMKTEYEDNGWKRFLFDLFGTFDYFNLFCNSSNAQWQFDPFPGAPGRQSLVNPKPDLAFGIKLQGGSIDMKLSKRLWDLTDPHVSPYCIPFKPLEMIFPFLVLESKSLQGSALAAESQMTNGLIKSLDVIASLGLETKLFAVGICQVGFRFEVYLAFSSRSTEELGVPRLYHIQLLSIYEFRWLADTLRFLRLLRQIIDYGLRQFQPQVLQALHNLCDQAPAIPGL